MRKYTTAHLPGHYSKGNWRKNRIGAFLILADMQIVSEKRTEQRIPLMARVDILWMDDESTPRVAPATLEDRSRGGISLRMKNSISLGSHIAIKSGTLQYSGIVTNCRRDKSGFTIGIKLDRPDDRNLK